MTVNNSAAVLIRLIKSLKIPVTSASVITEIDKHPYKNTLFALSDVLNYWNVPNGAYNVDFNDLKELSLPFIAYLSLNNGEFALVEKIEDEHFVISGDNRERKRIPYKNFQELYANSVLIAESQEGAGEADYSTKRRNEFLNKVRIPFLITATVVILISITAYHLYYGGTGLSGLALTLIKTCGLAASSLLIAKTIGAGNPFINRLCTAGNQKNLDCDTIIMSEASSFMGLISWAELGFFYFSGSLLFLVSGAFSGASLWVAAVLNVLCLPYTFYSVYYQYKIAQKWCILCCLVQALLWAEFFVLPVDLFSPVIVINAPVYLNLILSFALPVLFWVFVKPLVVSSAATDRLKKQLSKFVYNDNLFQSLLSRQKKHQLLNDSDTIVLGNVEAENVITVVSNPVCEPCAQTHKLLHGWISERENLKVQIVFSTGSDGNDIKAKIAGHFMALNEAAERETVKEAMFSWYNNDRRNYQGLADAYPLSLPATEPEPGSLEKQKEWCHKANVRATPAIFFNGYELPAPWQLEDLKYFL